MTKLIISVLFILIYSFAQCAPYDPENNRLVEDTIDYENKRIFLDIPEISLMTSNIITDIEGFGIYYPIIQKHGIIGLVVFDYSVMKRNYLIYTQDYEKELWNTFNRNCVGSRCFKKDNLYFRIDRYYDDLEIFYQNIEEEYFSLANKIINSVYIRLLNSDDKPLNMNKRKHGIIANYR